MINTRKAIIVGAGKVAHRLIEYMESLGGNFADYFYICLDNNSELWGTQLHGIPIEPIEEALKYPDMTIVICTVYEKDIRKQLAYLGIENPVMDIHQYKRQFFVNYQVNNYYRAHPVAQKFNCERISDLTVYTAIFGGYDSLREIICPSENVRYICFTDDKALHSDTWEIFCVDREFEDPILESRKYKMLPHRFIDTEYSLYMDANMQFKKSPLDYMNEYFGTRKILFIPHGSRDCIYRETAACIMIDKDLPQRLIHQAYTYSKHNCPEHSGLFWGGLIGRKHFDDAVVKFDNEWWDHFKQYSRRDQISLGYLMWNSEIEVSLANIDIHNNIWFTPEEHVKNTDGKSVH